MQTWLPTRLSKNMAKKFTIERDNAGQLAMNKQVTRSRGSIRWGGGQHSDHHPQEGRLLHPTCCGRFLGGQWYVCKNALG